jgi:hypothetical protein
MLVDPQVRHLLWELTAIGGVASGVGVIYAIIRWMSAVYRKGTEIVEHIDSIPSLNKAAIARAETTAIALAGVKAALDTVATNHLSHIEADIRDGRAEQTKLLTDMNTNIKILVDRGLRL